MVRTGAVQWVSCVGQENMHWNRVCSSYPYTVQPPQLFTPAILHMVHCAVRAATKSVMKVVWLT
jgi:hypothetical protein